MKIFNRDGYGSEELRRSIGLISADISFDKWEPFLPLGMRDVVGIIGREPAEAISAYYESSHCKNEALEQALKYLQQAVAFFTWLKMIPTLDAQHDDSGRSRRLGENEKGLTALQEFKDEENIRHLAYEAVDALIEVMEMEGFDFWLASGLCRIRKSLLIRSKEEFDEFYHIGSHRLFVTLLPIIREVQSSEIAPVVGDRYLSELLKRKSTCAVAAIGDLAARAVALLAMKKAVERLPVEVIPEGVVQVQQSQPVKSRLKAEQSARASVAASLGGDAGRLLQRLQDIIARLDAEPAEPDPHLPGPIAHSKGFSF